MGGDKRTEYPIRIISKNGTGISRVVSISIITVEGGGLTRYAGSDLEMSLKAKYLNNPQYSDVDTATRTIDGTSGAVASVSYRDDAKNFIDGYDATYQLTFDPRTFVQIYSFRPWNEGTLQLLKTIHVEKV